MHFIHISPEDLRKHPWIGVVIGVLGMVLFSFVTYVAARDYINFSKQKSPEIIDVENLVTDYPVTGKWVTLTNFTLDCETVEQTKRADPLEKLIVGEVYDTYIVITNSSSKQLIVAIFHGDVSCQNFQNKDLTGTLTTTQDYSYGVGYLNTKLSKTTSANLILRVNEGLGQITILLIIGIIFDIVFLFSFVIKYSRLWLEQWESKFD